MAVAFDTFGPFDAGAGANAMEQQWREFMSPVNADGVVWGYLNELAVFADSSGMQVKVPTGKLWAQGHAGVVGLQKTLPIAAAHASLQRLDLVVGRVDYVGNQIELDVLTGTPGSGTAPSTVTNSSKTELPLAIVTVDAAASTIAAAKVASRRVRVSNSLSISFYRQTSDQSIPNASFQRVLFDTTDAQVNNDISKATVSSGSEFTLLRQGMWRVTANFRFSNNGTSAHRELMISTDPNTSRQADSGIVTTGSPGFNVTKTFFGFEQTKISIWAWQNTGGAVDSTSASQEVNCEFHFLG